MGLYRDQGIVLRTWRLGESDRIVNLLTERHGKVRAVVKGVRKTKSRFGGRLEPMVHCSLLFYEGRELDIVTQAETLEYFRPVREDLARLAKASSLLEATDQLAQERHANVRLYAMLLGGLRALAAADAALLVPAFFLKLLSTEGFHPLLDECAICGERYGLEGFDLAQGGVLCTSCASRGGDDVALSAAGLDLIRRILGGDLVGALAAPVTPATTEVERLATRAMEHHLERRLRSVPVAGALAGD
jgi:DNA repair protein RecO (recombination protein O)